MAECLNCRNPMEYVEQYNQYYCGYCRQYQQLPPSSAPPPPPPPPPPRPPPSQYQPPRYQQGPPKKMPAIIGTIIVVIMVVVIAAIFLISFMQDDSGETKTMSMQEFMYDEFNQYQYGFRTLEPGDTLKIRDTITYIDYDYYDDTTFIEFVGGGLPFDGDLTNRFSVYDEVIITLHIIEISDYSYSFEYFEEGWDGDNYVPFPSSSIKLA